MPRAAWLTQRIAERSRQQLEQQVQEMELAAQHASAADPAIRDLAQRNAALAAQILKNSTNWRRSARPWPMTNMCVTS